MVSKGMLCVKYLLFCFNLLFALSGIVILTFGAIIQANYYHYKEFVDPNYATAPLILIIVGVIIFVVAFFGCCGAARESHCMIISFSVFLLLIFSIELAAGIAGYIRRDQVQNMLEKTLNSTMLEYTDPDRPEVKKSWDLMQHELGCCGINGPADWRVAFKNDSLPHTCCKDYPDDGKCNMRVSEPILTKEPCLPKLKSVFEQYACVLGIVGISVALVQLIGVIFACCLARSIRMEYETV